MSDQTNFDAINDTVLFSRAIAVSQFVESEYPELSIRGTADIYLIALARCVRAGLTDNESRIAVISAIATSLFNACINPNEKDEDFED